MGFLARLILGGLFSGRGLLLTGASAAAIDQMAFDGAGTRAAGTMARDGLSAMGSDFAAGAMGFDPDEIGETFQEMMNGDFNGILENSEMLAPIAALATFLFQNQLMGNSAFSSVITAALVGVAAYAVTKFVMPKFFGEAAAADAPAPAPEAPAPAPQVMEPAPG